MTTLTVQALRDTPLHPPMTEGETRDYPIEEARALIAIGLVVEYQAKPRAQRKAKAED